MPRAGSPPCCRERRRSPGWSRCAGRRSASSCRMNPARGTGTPSPGKASRGSSRSGNPSQSWRAARSRRPVGTVRSRSGMTTGDPSPRYLLDRQAEDPAEKVPGESAGYAARDERHGVRSAGEELHPDDPVHDGQGDGNTKQERPDELREDDEPPGRRDRQRGGGDGGGEYGRTVLHPVGEREQRAVHAAEPPASRRRLGSGSLRAARRPSRSFALSTASKARGCGHAATARSRVQAEQAAEGAAGYSSSVPYRSGTLTSIPVPPRPSA